jgi:ParB-like chromosome segregation protein Spo0J
MAEVEMVDIPVSAVGESFGRLRIIDRQSEAMVLESLRTFGRILPVVVVQGSITGGER